MNAGGTLLDFFSPREPFAESERILRHKITALLVVTFFLSIGIALFSVYRLATGNTVAGISQALFSLFLIAGFVLLKRSKRLFRPYAFLFFLLFFTYINIVFFFVPENRLNILWIVTAPVPIFFFLDRGAGLLMLALLLGFVLFLIVTRYPYSVAEYITLLATLGTTALILHTYEKIKDEEQERLRLYNSRLETAIAQQTEQLNRQHIELQEHHAALQAVNQQLEKRIESEVAQRLEQEQMLLRQYRMATLGEMLDAIAHQWRQPLMNVNVQLMHLEHAAERCPDAAFRAPIDAIAELTAYMSDTIEDFRRLLLPERSRETVRLAELFSEVRRLMANTLHDVTWIEKTTGEPSVRTSRSELLQVMIILVSNAVEQFARRGVTDPRLIVEAAARDGETVIAVEDNAGGIPPPLSRIFDPYYSTKKKEGGSGLGLYIAKIIIEQYMFGSIDARNTGHGARFTIRIPQKETV
jgi:signal transduction histidine kinase